MKKQNLSLGKAIERENLVPLENFQVRSIGGTLENITGKLIALALREGNGY